ncbi:hypothetical protein KJ742_07400 [Patescibacteria group bacterium]|nr:hypothetical protein [Patescibacteria group bacterium]
MTNGGGPFQGILDLFTGEKPELDKLEKATKKELDKLKKSPAQANIMTNIEQVGAEALVKDLNDLNIPASQHQQYIDLYRQHIHEQMSPMTFEQIARSPEMAALDTYIANVEHYTQLTGVIEQAKSSDSEPIKTFFRNLKKRFPQAAGWITAILPFLKSKEGDEVSDVMINEIQASLTEDVPPPVAADVETPPAATSETAPDIEPRVELPAAAQSMVDAGFKLGDISEIRTDMNGLKGELGSESAVEDLISKALRADSNLQKAQEKVRTQLTNEASNVTYRLTDAYILDGEHLTDAQVENVLAAIDDITTPQEMRELFNRANTSPESFD